MESKRFARLFATFFVRTENSSAVPIVIRRLAKKPYLFHDCLRNLDDEMVFKALP